MLIEIIKPDYEHKDERGSLVQLIRRGYSQINIVFSKSGMFRGGHYHKLNTEAYYLIQGECKVTASFGEIVEIETFHQGDFFRIGPGIKHNFDYLQDTIMATMYSLGVELDNGEMDIY